MHTLLERSVLFSELSPSTKKTRGDGLQDHKPSKGSADMLPPSLHLPHISQSTANWKALQPFSQAFDAAGIDHAHARVLTSDRGCTRG